MIATGASVIGGNYWVVWPAVFHANLTQYRRGGPAVYGFTYRSAATDGLWMTRSDTILASPAGDRTMAAYARRAGLSIAHVERHGAFDVYVIRKSN